MGKNNKEEQNKGPQRARLPKGNQVIGVIEQRVGGGRMIVRCMDGHSRNCRVPGRLKKFLWLREGNVVIVEPQKYEEEEKGSVLYKYNRSQVNWLKKKGHLKDIEEEF